jgi:hypothetical protein
MKLTKAQWEARGQAYSEAAEHLRQNWTDDPDEWEQGKGIAEKLDQAATACFEIAASMS